MGPAAKSPLGKTAQQHGTSRLGVGREAHSKGQCYHTALGKRELLLCMVSSARRRRKNPWVRAPYRENGFCSRGLCLLPRAPYREFRGRRPLALLPRTPLDASCPALVVDGADFGVSWRVSLVSLPAPPFCSRSSYAAFAGRSGRTRESVPARTSARPVHFPSRSSARSKHPGFSEAVPTLLSL